MFSFLDRHTREIHLTKLSLAITGAAGALLVWSTSKIAWSALEQEDMLGFIETGLFGALAGFLIYGNLCYEIARLGRFRRMDGRGAHPDGAASCFGADAPGLTILVPSYREEISVIRQTLISAALQQYPHKRVVLLLDDPPAPKSSTGSGGALGGSQSSVRPANSCWLPLIGTSTEAKSAFRSRQSRKPHGAERRMCVPSPTVSGGRRSGSRCKRSWPRSTRTQMSGLWSISSSNRPRPAVNRPQNGSLGESHLLDVPGRRPSSGHGGRLFSARRPLRGRIRRLRAQTVLQPFPRA